MRRIVIRRPGGYERLVVETAPDPLPRHDEVLIQTRACGVNYADGIVRMGLYSSAWKYVGYPITPGFEVAGTVVAVGASVKNLAPGAAVMAVTRFGGYATHVVVPRHQVFPIPTGFSMEQAAAFPAVSLTAHFALSEAANVRAGHTVLIHSAAGGVGSAAIVLAKIAGAKVVAVVGRAEKVPVAKALGADVVIDKRSQSLWSEAERAAPKGYDIILDANGRETLRASYRHLRPTGKLVVYGFHSMLSKTGKVAWLSLAWNTLLTPLFSPMLMTNDNKSLLGFNLSFLFEDTELLERAMGALLPLANAGKMPPPAVRTFALDDAASAQRTIESGTTTGKLVLLP